MKNKGFTLIEFIVVLAMVGILSAILVPNIFSRQEADENQLNNQRLMVDKALTLCFALEGRYPPTEWTDTSESPPVIRNWRDYLIRRNYLTSLNEDIYVYSHYDQNTGRYDINLR